MTIPRERANSIVDTQAYADGQTTGRRSKICRNGDQPTALPPIEVQRNMRAASAGRMDDHQPASMADKVALSSRRERGKAERRARIVDAAYMLLRQVGVAELSVKMITEQAGFSNATAFNLFGSKSAILEKVYERDTIIFRDLVNARTESDSLDRFFDCISISADQYRSDPHFYRFILRLPDADANDKEIDSQIFRLRAEFWSELVEAAIVDGHIESAANAVQIGAFLTYTATGALFCWLANMVTIDQFERDGIQAVAASLMAFATPKAQARLAARLAAATGGHQRVLAANAR